MIDPDGRAPRTEIPLLTTMRGVAALVVVLFHAGYTPFSRGFLAVDFFFMLSGFVLMHVYGAEFRNEVRPAAVGSFLWKRFARIYPTHAATTLFLLPQINSAVTGYTPTDLLTCLLLGQVLLHHPAFNDLAWSVSAEWFVYLGFPLLALIVGRTSRCGLVVLAAICTALYIGLCDEGSHTLGWTAVVGRTLPEFVAGMIIYRLYAARWQFWLWSGSAMLLCCLALLSIAFWFGARQGLVVLLLLPLLYAGACSQNRLGNRLEKGLPLWLGEASYAIYLGQALALVFCHGMAVFLASAIAGEDALRVIFVGLTVGIGALIHRCIDQPCRVYLRRLGRKLARKLAVPPAGVPTTATVPAIPSPIS